MLLTSASPDGPARWEHVTFLLALALFMLRVVANDANHTLAFDDLAFVTDLLDGSSNFHDGLLRTER